MASRGSGARSTAVAWSTIALVLVVAQYISSNTRSGSSLVVDRWHGLRAMLGGWVQFDGWEYLQIAQHGYWYRPDARAPIVFFPLYALVVRGVDAVIGQPIVSGVLVSATSGLVAALLYSRWLGVVGVAGTARRWALAVFLLYPYGWFLYGPVYSDALFVALVLGAFLLVEGDRLVLAGVVGAFATATRPTGLALVVGLFVLAIERSGAFGFAPTRHPRWWVRLGLPTSIDRHRLRRRLLWPLVALAGVGTYSVYLGVRFGVPLVWATSSSEYAPTGWRTWLKAGFVRSWIDLDDPVFVGTITAQALILLGVFLSAPAVGKRFGWGYAAFIVALATIPTLATSNFLGVGRYLLPAFPVAALVGEWLERRRMTAVLWCALSGIALLVMNLAFARSRMLS